MLLSASRKYTCVPYKIGQVEEANAAVVRVMHQIDELGEAHARLIRLPLAAVHAGALAEPRHLDVRVAELDDRRRGWQVGCCGGRVVGRTGGT